MFDRYTESARRVIFYGRGEASKFGNGQIESEHLLIGLLDEDRDLATRFFQSADAVDTVRPKVADRFPGGQVVPDSADMPLSEAAKQVLQYAAEESERLKDYHIAPAHLLLGLLRDKESVAAEILTEHGVSATEVRQYLLSQPALAGAVQPPTAEIGMMQMITGFWASRAIYTAAKLGIADLVKDAPKTAAELAAGTGSHADSLYRMLRALASIGVFVELPGERFASSPLARTLEERPGTLRYFAMSELGQEHYSAWEQLPYSIRTGGLAFEERFHQKVWEYFAAHPDDAAVFNRSMSTLTEWVTQAILAAYDFSPFQKIVDVGGGQGAFLTAMLSKAPQARGVLFDAPQVIGAAAALGERVEQVAGDFFEAVPEGGDLYTLKMILHDWNDAECHSILANIRKAIAPGGKLVIVETVLAAGPDAPFKNFLDLNMMVMTGGRERTEPAFRTLLEKAGFHLNRIVPTASPMSILEAVAG